MEGSVCVNVPEWYVIVFSQQILFLHIQVKATENREVEIKRDVGRNGRRVNGRRGKRGGGGEQSCLWSQRYEEHTVMTGSILCRQGQ